MAYGIGIDTGGTYTDAVIYDYGTKEVLAAGKSPTTREDLSLGIGRALDALPAELLRQAEVAALSTTLATNACVEDKGGRARLVMMGSTQKTLRWVDAEKKYGLHYDDVLCLDTHGSFDGSVVDHPDWQAVMAENDDFLSQAEALGVVELNAMHNGGVCEAEARDALAGRYGLNIMERGATALLNARLLPVVEAFIRAVDRALMQRGLGALHVIVRSDGSLMVEELAKRRPVETILSGPAASVIGCRALTDCENALIVDMGGTTTDISILRGGAPQMTGGIRIGAWRTQIRGVFIDTFGLGGDTRLVIADHRLALDTRRVEPLCAAAVRWPRIRDELEALLAQTRPHTRPLHEFLCLVREPARPERYTDAERRLMDVLADGPVCIGGSAVDMYSLNSERLEREGVVMRCGLTPTDIMHIRGDYTAFDEKTARLAARYFLRALPDMEDDEENLAALCERVYELVERRLFENVARVFIESAYPDIYKDGLDSQTEALIARKWARRGEKEGDGFFSLSFDASAALVGIGAPIHLFLPEVAKALGVRCVIPAYSGVANAIGAAAADVSARAVVEIRSGFGADGAFSYTIHASDRMERFEDADEALEAARAAAKELAVSEARRRGAMGELSVTVETDAHQGTDRYGAAVDLGVTVTACARGRMRD